MKHLKSFEEVDWSSQETGEDDSWKLGSYILASIDDFSEEAKRELDLSEDTKEVYGQVTKWRNDGEFPFEVVISNGHKINFTQDEILKYLTPEEIEQYKMELEASKYNL